MKVKFVPQNVEFEVNPDQSVMKLAQKNGVYIKSICGGLPSCAECRVRVVEGDQNVLPPSAKELTLIGTGYFIDQRRLSCQLKCFGDVTIDLTEQVAKQSQVETRRPQGSKKPETEASHAVSGNLIQQDDALKTVAEDLERNGNRQNNNRGGGQGRNRGGRHRNKNPNQKQGSASGNQQSREQRQQGQGQRPQGQQQQRGGQQGPQNRSNVSPNQSANRGNSGNRHDNRGGGQQGRREGGSGGDQSGRGPGSQN